MSTNPIHKPILIDTHAACDLLAISPRTLWQLTKDGVIPCRRIGRSVRYLVRELEAAAERGFAKPPANP